MDAMEENMSLLKSTLFQQLPGINKQVLTYQMGLTADKTQQTTGPVTERQKQRETAELNSQTKQVLITEYKHHAGHVEVQYTHFWSPKIIFGKIISKGFQAYEIH